MDRKKSALKFPCLEQPGKSSLSPPGGIMLFKTRPGILESWVKHQAGGWRGFENGITMRQDSINGLMRDHTIQVHDDVKEENLYTGRVLPLKRALAPSVQGFYLKEVICGKTAHCSQALETRQGTEDCQLRSGLRRKACSTYEQSGYYILLLASMYFIS